MLFVCLRSDYRVSEDVSFRIAVAVRMAVADSANEITDVLDMASGRSDGACTERAYHRRLLSILRHVETEMEEDSVLRPSTLAITASHIKRLEQCTGL